MLASKLARATCERGEFRHVEKIRKIRNRAWSASMRLPAPEQSHGISRDVVANVDKRFEPVRAAVQLSQASLSQSGNTGRFAENPLMLADPLAARALPAAPFAMTGPVESLSTLPTTSPFAPGGGVHAPPPNTLPLPMPTAPRTAPARRTPRMPPTPRIPATIAPTPPASLCRGHRCAPGARHSAAAPRGGRARRDQPPPPPLGSASAPTWRSAAAGNGSATIPGRRRRCRAARPGRRRRDRARRRWKLPRRAYVILM